MLTHPGIDPHPVPIFVAEGVLDPRVRYNVTADFLADHPSLAIYQVNPPRLARVFAGDDPAEPAWTVGLRFEDQAEMLASALGAYWVQPEEL